MFELGLLGSKFTGFVVWITGQHYYKICMKSIAGQRPVVFNLIDALVLGSNAYAGQGEVARCSSWACWAANSPVLWFGLLGSVIIKHA